MSDHAKKRVFNASIKTFLRPVESFIEDHEVTEIMINGSQDIFIEKNGMVSRVDVHFDNEDALQAAVRNIAQSVGRIIDDKNPRLDARLPDGSRVHAVLPPCSRNGTTIAI